MGKVFIEESTLSSIGSAIRSKTGSQDLISPLDMATQIEGITSGTEINGKEKLFLNLSDTEIPAGSFITTECIVTDPDESYIKLSSGGQLYNQYSYTKINDTTMAFIGMESSSGYGKVITFLEDGTAKLFEIGPAFGQATTPSTSKVPAILVIDDKNFVLIRDSSSSYPPWRVTLADDYQSIASITKVTDSGVAFLGNVLGGFQISHLRDDLYVLALANTSGSYKDSLYIIRYDVENNALERLCSYSCQDYSSGGVSSMYVQGISESSFVYVMRGKIYTFEYDEINNKIVQSKDTVVFSATTSTYPVSRGLDRNELFINISGVFYLYKADEQILTVVGYGNEVYQTTSATFTNRPLEQLTPEVAFTYQASSEYIGFFKMREGTGFTIKDTILNFSSTLNNRWCMYSIINPEINLYRIYNYAYYSSYVYLWHLDVQVGIREAKASDRIIGIASENIAPNEKGGCYVLT